MHVGLPEMQLHLDAVARSKPLFDLLGVAYVTGPARWAGALERAGLLPLRAATDTSDGLWRNPAALPRSFLVRRVRAVADADAAFAAVSAPDFRPRDEAVVEMPLDADLGRGPVLPGETTHVVRRTPAEVVVAVQATGPALLVVTDTHYPGWRARVGGQPVEMRRVDFAFRGVVVPPGTQEVTFTYAPGSVAVGAGLSAVGLVLVAALWWFAPRARPG
jgi:hypothetical protein